MKGDNTSDTTPNWLQRIRESFATRDNNRNINNNETSHLIATSTSASTTSSVHSSHSEISIPNSSSHAHDDDNLIYDNDHYNKKRSNNKDDLITSSLPNNTSSSHSHTKKKHDNKDGKCIVDVPFYGSIQDQTLLRRHHSRRHRREAANYKHYMGLILTLFSSVFSSLSGLTVKLLEKEYHSYNICFWRFLHIFFIATIYLLVSRLWSTRPIWPRPIFEEKYEHVKNICILMLRGILGCSGRILYIYSITCLTLADSMVIASSTPVFMSFFAYFLIGEPCGLMPVLVAVCAMTGVTVISRPPFLTGEENYNTTILVGTLTGVVGMILTTLVMITMRKLRHIHHSLITMSFAFFGLIAALILSLQFDVFAIPSGFNNITLMYFSGLTSFFGQTFLTLGLKYEDAGPVALLKNFDVIFAFIWEFIFLHVAPDVYSLGGGCIVIFCIILTTVRKWLSTLPEGDEIRSTFSIILK